MHPIASGIIAVLFALSGTSPAIAQQQSVDLQLVLLADATGSIDQREIAFQRQGYATAITDPVILDAISQGFDQRIAVTYIEWADATSQDIVVPWTVVDGAAAAKQFADALLAAPRRAFGRNAIGQALAFAKDQLDTSPFRGFRQIIDFSADSANNWNGMSIAAGRAFALQVGVTINGLAVLCRSCPSGRPITYDLEAAFRSDIIGGPGAFVVTADSDESFAQAVRNKLLLEIANRPPDELPTLLASSRMDRLVPTLPTIQNR